MKIYVALLRAVNVGGWNSLPMKEFVAILEDLGSGDIKTYVNSGNAVFANKEKNASLLSQKIRDGIKRRRGFETLVLLLELKEVEAAIRKNPFPEAENDGGALHLGFLASAPTNPDLQTLESLKRGRERFCLIDKVFYLNAPDGIGRSKLAAKAEKLLGVAMTDRNWRTACKVLEMARELV